MHDKQKRELLLHSAMSKNARGEKDLNNLEFSNNHSSDNQILYTVIVLPIPCHNESLR